MGIEAKVIADSVSPAGKRITTLQLKFPRFILAQFNTHRAFSRNARSSRAVPTEKLVAEVGSDPVIPIEWRRAQKGMVAGDLLDHGAAKMAQYDWLQARDWAVCWAKELNEDGVAKEIVNRLLEPFMWAHVVVTATEWENFFALRLAHDAQPEMRLLAESMMDAISGNKPRKVDVGDWHMPYVTEEEIDTLRFARIHVPTDEEAEACLSKVRSRSVARCARVSYRPFDGSEADAAKDEALAERLLASGHMSPFEHQARVVDPPILISNFVGWEQYRKTINGESRSFDIPTAEVSP